jgi:tRNA U54 and U55 pseudouridine synthase Pus10
MSLPALPNRCTPSPARYQKLSREMPQTAWIMGGVRKGKASVEEVVAEPIKEVRPTHGGDLVSA